MHLSKPFANPAEMKEILGEINGPGGPLGAFDLTISKDWDQTTWTLAGSAGLTGGIAGFVDPDLAAAFGTSKPLEQLVEESGVPVEQGLNLTVTVDMPHQKDGLTCECPSTDGKCRSRWRPPTCTSGRAGRRSSPGSAVRSSPGGSPTGPRRAVLRVSRRRDPFTST